MSSYGLWLSASGMKVNDHRQTVLANNMANAHTTGFKQDLAVIAQRRVESQSAPGGFPFAHAVLDGLAGGHQVQSSYHDFEQGPIERTGKALDVAIEGEGFLAVTDGEVTRYTRAGEFALNAAGELVLVSGEGRWRVLDDGERRIELDPAGGEIRVSQDGSIRQNKVIVATLGLMTADDKQLLRKVGNNLYEASDAEMAPIQGRFIPESREESNFDALKGLATMIEATRAYQLNSTMLQLQDQLTGQAVQTVGRIVG
jgi:flagellar basal-body rod protein FlgG